MTHESLGVDREYDEGALRAMFEAYWPHRDTWSGRTVLRRIIAAMRANRG